MTREDIIAANPEFEWWDTKIANWNGLSYVDADGVPQGVVWKGDALVCAPLPWTRLEILTAARNLDALQPGKEFKTRGADKYAEIMREAGFSVISGEDGEPKSFVKAGGATRRINRLKPAEDELKALKSK